MEKLIICTVCPRGCRITVSGDNGVVNSVEGYGCMRGKTYASNEFISPVRILTTTVKVEGLDNELLPVRSSKPLPKDKIFDCIDVIKGVTVKAPINRYDVIVKDICGTGIDMVATKNI